MRGPHPPAMIRCTAPRCSARIAELYSRPDARLTKTWCPSSAHLSNTRHLTGAAGQFTGFAVECWRDWKNSAVGGKNAPRHCETAGPRRLRFLICRAFIPQIAGGAWLTCLFSSHCGQPAIDAQSLRFHRYPLSAQQVKCQQVGQPMPPANTGEKQENEPTLSQNIRAAAPGQGLELSKVGAASPRHPLSEHPICYYLTAVKCQNSNSY